MVAIDDTSLPSKAVVATLTETVKMLILGKPNAMVDVSVTNAVANEHGRQVNITALDSDALVQFNGMGLPPVPTFPTTGTFDTINLAMQGLQSGMVVGKTSNFPTVTCPGQPGITFVGTVQFVAMNPSPQFTVVGDVMSGGASVEHIMCGFTFPPRSGAMIQADLSATIGTRSIHAMVKRTGP